MITTGGNGADTVICLDTETGNKTALAWVGVYQFRESHLMVVKGKI